MGFSCYRLSNWTLNRGDFMSLADGIILLIVLVIVISIIYRMIKKKDESICANCAYAKGCNEDCSPKKKTIS